MWPELGMATPPVMCEAIKELKVFAKEFPVDSSARKCRSLVLSPGGPEAWPLPSGALLFRRTK